MQRNGLWPADFAQSFAERWVAAWNAGDLDAALALYSDDFEMRSPNIVAVANQESGVLRGKPAVAAYWAAAIRHAPPHFELLGVYAGIGCIAIRYRGRREVIEVLEFDSAGRVIRGSANWLIGS